LDGAKDKPEGVNRVKQMLPQYLQDIQYDDQTETKRGASVVTGKAKGKKTGVDVVFAVGVMDDGAGGVVGAAFVVDSGIEEHYKPSFAEQTYRFPLIDGPYLYPAACLSPLPRNESDRFRELGRN